MENFSKQVKRALVEMTQAQKILIIPSSPVDADALGSALALAEILETQGKSAIINYSLEHLGNLQFLPGTEQIKIQDLTTLDLEPFDLLIFLDSGSLKQFYDGFTYRQGLELPVGKSTLNIDHHLTNEGFAQVTVHRLDISSTCQLVYELFCDQIKLTPSLATNLLAGIVCDTGNFRYGKVTPELLRIAADLLAAGANLPEIAKNLFYTTSAKVINLTGYLLGKIQINDRYHYGFFTLTFDEWQRFDLSLEEFRDAYHRVLEGGLTSIQGLDFVFVVREQAPGNVGISFRVRSSGRFDLTPVAKSLGGGGHPNACGAKIFDRPVAEVLAMVERAIEENYEKIKIKR